MTGCVQAGYSIIRLISSLYSFRIYGELGFFHLQFGLSISWALGDTTIEPGKEFTFFVFSGVCSQAKKAVRSVRDRIQMYTILDSMAVIRRQI